MSLSIKNHFADFGTLITSIRSNSCIIYNCNYFFFFRFRVILGEFDISRDPDCISSPESTVCAEPSRVYGISNTIKHQNFDRFNAINDIALIQLDRDVIFSGMLFVLLHPEFNTV